MCELHLDLQRGRDHDSNTTPNQIVNGKNKRSDRLALLCGRLGVDISDAGAHSDPAPFYEDLKCFKFADFLIIKMWINWSRDITF